MHSKIKFGTRKGRRKKKQAYNIFTQTTKSKLIILSTPMHAAEGKKIKCRDCGEVAGNENT